MMEVMAQARTSACEAKGRKNMLEAINIRSSVAVYVQIENEVQFAIAAGRLKAGDQLPTVRELSERIGVNPNTVAKAYRDLEVRGLLFTRRGMGVFVNRGIEARCRQESRKQTADRLCEVVAEAKAAGMTLAAVKDIIAKSLASEIGPYGEVPADLLALAKPRK